jgi:hypothetical protein
MKSMPELLMLIKGLVNALRSVSVTFMFLLGITWVFAIIFLQQYQGKGKPGLSDDYFHNLFFSMITFFINGTLTDEVTSVGLLLMEDNTVLFILWFIFVILASLTLLNMLIGVLTDVVGKTADAEKRLLALSDAKKTLKKVFQATDTDGSGMVSLTEFEALVDRQNPGFNPKVLKALASLGIHEDRLKELKDHLFYGDTFSDFLEENEMQVTKSECIIRDHPETSRSKKLIQHKTLKPESRELTFDQFMDELLLLIPKSGGICVREMAVLRRDAFMGLRIQTESVKETKRELRHIADELSAELASARAKHTAVKHQAEVAARLAAKEADAKAKTKKNVAVRRRLQQVPTDMLLAEVTKRLESRSADQELRELFKMGTKT